MSSRLKTGAWLLALAAAAHLLTVVSIPYLVTWTSLRAAHLQDNTLYHGKVKNAPRDTVPYDNAYNMSSFVVYDVSAAPVRVQAKLPEGVPYWSIAVNGYNTDQLFVINDLQLPEKQVTLVIAHAGQDYHPANNERLVRSPSQKGVVLVRMLLPNRDDSALVARLAQVQKLASVEVLISPQRSAAENRTIAL